MKNQYIVCVRTARAKKFMIFLFGNKKDAKSFASDCEFKGGCEVREATVIGGGLKQKRKKAK